MNRLEPAVATQLLEKMVLELSEWLLAHQPKSELHSAILSHYDVNRDVFHMVVPDFPLEGVTCQMELPRYKLIVTDVDYSVVPERQGDFAVAQALFQYGRLVPSEVLT